MYCSIIRNDILNSKVTTLTTMIFVAAAATLVSLAAVLAVNLSGGIDRLMTRAQTPHFLQMHSGPVNIERLAAFAERNDNVDKFQLLEFLNVDGASIVMDGNSLADSVQDNGFCTQSDKFDYLLDLNGKVVNVSDGGIYIPICYMKEKGLKVGDRAVVGGEKFTVAGFIRDSQMNSLLASSKRFLVSKNDYAKIKKLGSTEYLIEFRLKDLSRLGAFETAYTAAGLEANGPTITYPLFKLINAIADGLMIAIILVVGILVVAIAFMCIRFTLLAKIEDDYREIGVMKAIGLRVSDIKKIYLAKYAAVAAAACILGFAFSFLFRGLLLENIRLYMGESENARAAWLLALTGVLIIFLAIVAYVSGVLGRFRKIPAAEAVRSGASPEKSRGAGRFCLSANRLFNANCFLGIKDVLARKRLYATMLAVLVISLFIIIVPQNLYHTISSPDFVTYMGIGKCDMRLDIQQTDNISEKAGEIARVMENDPSIAKYAVLTTKTFRVGRKSGSEKRIKIELGDHSVFPVKYLAGRAPHAAHEIALSAMNADQLGKRTGDFITLAIDGKEKNLKVCGIYSDITNGGKTAKAVFPDSSGDVMWCVVCAQLADKSLVDARVAKYADQFGYAKVSGIDAYVAQTFGSTISSVKKASGAAIAVALIITVLVVLLMMKMLIAKDKYSIAVMKAIGLTNSDITVQYVSRSLFVLLAGMVLGTILANTFGEALAGAVISRLGAPSFKFAVDPAAAYLLGPLMMAAPVLIATIAGASGLKKIRISETITG